MSMIYTIYVNIISYIMGVIIVALLLPYTYYASDEDKIERCIIELVLYPSI